MPSIAVSGASSLIGSALAQAALARGFKVVCFAQKNSARLKYIPGEAKILFADLSEYEYLEIDETCDIFFHLAWEKTGMETRDDCLAHSKNIQYTLEAVNVFVEQ